MRSASIAFMSILFAALASPVSADNDKGKRNDHGGPKAEKSDNDRGRGNNDGNNDDRGNSGGGAFDHREADPVVTMRYPQIVVVDRDRDIVRAYYRTEHAAGRCPPGLAMKRNGCLPPGQANRMWVLGQPLPTEIVYAPMPREVWRQLTPAPYGYEYVRVADDVVLISTVTRVIVAPLGNLRNVGD